MTSHFPALLDCDPGIDDAFAIFCAARLVDLRAITTVSGNVPVEHTTRNALHVTELAGLDQVPVHRGAERPLVLEPMFADDVHGAAGLGLTETPRPRRDPASTDAVEAILQHALLPGGVVIATGPLTNLAAAYRADPDAFSRIEHIHWMGGSTTVGNITPVAEFNAWADPHAAAEVFSSPVPITMYGLNLTHQVRLGGADIETLRRAATPTARLAAEWLEFYARNSGEHRGGQPMHDPCAVLGAVRPELFDFESMRLSVRAEDSDRRGATVLAGHPDDGGLDVRVATTAQAEEIRRIILDSAIAPSEPW